MTQQQFIEKYNLKEFTTPVKNSDGKYIQKLEGYIGNLKGFGYELSIEILFREKTLDLYRVHLKEIITSSFPKEIFAMNTTEWSLFEKITYDLVQNYIK
jgi:hypothetical protein